MLRSLLMACVLVVVPLQGHANPTAETEEMDFLDLVDGEGNVLIQARGVDAVNAEARAQGLAFPALGYWSVEGHCFVKPASGDCNGVLPLRAFRRLRCRGMRHAVVHAQRRKQHEVARHQAGGDNNSRENL